MTTIMNIMNTLNISEQFFLFRLSNGSISTTPFFETQEEINGESLSNPSLFSRISENDLQMLYDTCQSLPLGKTEQILVGAVQDEFICILSRIDENTVATRLVSVHDLRVQDVHKKAHTRLAELVGIIRHDVMNQLTAILGYYEIMDDMIPEEIRPFMQKEVELAGNLRRIVDSTRYLQEIGRNPVKWVSLKSLISKYKNASSLQFNYIGPDSLADVEIFIDPEFDPGLYRIFEPLKKTSPPTDISYGFEKVSSDPECADSLCIWFSDNQGYFEGFAQKKVFHHTFLPTGPASFYALSEICNMTNITPKIHNEPGCRLELLIPASSYLIL